MVESKNIFKKAPGVQSGSSNQEDTLNSGLFSLPPVQFSLLASLIGILLIYYLDINQQNSLGNFFVSLGQSLLTAASQGELLQEGTQSNDHIRQQIQIIKKQLHEVEQELNQQG